MRTDPLRSLLVVSALTMGLLLIALTVAEGSLGVAVPAGSGESVGELTPEPTDSDGTPDVTAEGSGHDQPPALPSVEVNASALAPALPPTSAGAPVEVPVAVVVDAPPRATGPAAPDSGDEAEGSDPVAAGAPRIARVGSRETPCGFDVRRHAVARTVTRSEPAGTTGPFEANGQPLYFFVELTNRLENRQRARVVITHVASGTSLSGNVEVGVSSRWRTWVDLIPPPSLLGPWEVRVLDSERCLAAQYTFETIPPGWQ